MLKSVKIDTMTLVSKLSKEQKSELYDLVDFRKDYGDNFKFSGREMQHINT